MLRLNCGSGGVRFDGWINLDADPAAEPDVLVDLGKTIPYPTASVDFIHSEDFVSCLPDMPSVRTFLREAHRVLKPGGVMRLLVPSLDRLVEAFRDQPGWLIEHWNRAVGVPLQPETAGHLLNLALKLNPGFMFDVATLRLLLSECGFAAREVLYNESPHADLRGLDLRRPEQSISMYWECDPV
ncbi:MAG: methyltransferase domain-containing protein [Xanthomonadales bacterium]|nr:methyltransferase domain-containing protein [Xanthomonadales bacterium]